jgi:hypothetical protein
LDGLVKAALSRSIERFERRWGYDASYMRDLLEASPAAFIRFGLVSSLGRQRSAPPEALAAAGLAGTLAEDCGPCTQIGVDMALASGVRPEALKAVLADDEAGMGETAALGWRFARAVLARDLDGAETARREVARRWGGKAVVALGLALTTSRMYPTLKYALGHGRACAMITVAGQPARPRRPVLEAA